MGSLGLGLLRWWALVKEVVTMWFSSWYGALKLCWVSSGCDNGREMDEIDGNRKRMEK